MAKIKLKYFGYHPYNNPTHAERNVELPIAFWFLRKFAAEPDNVIEVGEVTPFYKKPRYAVFDPVPEKSTTIKKNALDLDYGGKNLLSISTIEHIGTADYGQKPDPALLPVVLKKMLGAKNYLITFALGYNRQLEHLVQDEHFIVLERVAATKWRQTADKNLARFKYHSPWYAGNGLCILTNLKNLEFEFFCRNPLAVVTRFRAPEWSWKNYVKATIRELSDARKFNR